eukprot:1264676-Amorphochlora_amoeboformis.AAC.2
MTPISALFPPFFCAYARKFRPFRSLEAGASLRNLGGCFPESRESPVDPGKPRDYDPAIFSSQKQ